MHLYSGDYDFLLNHLGSELTIQNMTWFGAQGFQQKPNNNFLVDGQVVGNWGYEVSACLSNRMTFFAWPGSLNDSNDREDFRITVS